MKDETRHLYLNVSRGAGPKRVSVWCGKKGTLKEMWNTVVLGVGPTTCKACLKAWHEKKPGKTIPEEKDK